MSCYAAALRVSGDSGREVEAAEGVWGEEGGDLEICAPRRVSTLTACGMKACVLSSQAKAKKASCPFARAGMRRQRVPGQRPAAEEDSDLFAAAVPGWQRRHRHLRVVGEHGDDRVDVVALPGGDVALDNLSQRAVA